MKVIVTTTGCVDYKKKLYFKGDEIELSDKAAKHLLDKGVCGLCDDGEIARTPALSEMTVTSLKELLDKLEVSYDAKIKKDDLIALIEGERQKSEVSDQ